jgi:hypothetical protein
MGLTGEVEVSVGGCVTDAPFQRTPGRTEEIILARNIPIFDRINGGSSNLMNGWGNGRPQPSVERTFGRTDEALRLLRDHASLTGGLNSCFLYLLSFQ